MKKVIFLITVLFFPVIAVNTYAETRAGEQSAAQNQLREDGDDDAISVKVDGIGTIKDDITAARKIAISDGLRIAVEQAKGVMVKSETEVKDYAEIKDEVVSRSKGFVRTYKILNEAKEDNVYRVTLEVEVMLAGPKAEAPIKMDEQAYKARIPKLHEEIKFLFNKTNQLAGALQNKREGTLNPEKAKELSQRYRVMLMVVKSIDPPSGKKDKIGILIKAARVKGMATDIFAKYIAGDRGQAPLMKGFELNRLGNQLIKQFIAEQRGIDERRGVNTPRFRERKKFRN